MNQPCPWASRVNLAVAVLGLRGAVRTVECYPVFGEIGTKEDGSVRKGWVRLFQFSNGALPCISYWLT